MENSGSDKFPFSIGTNMFEGPVPRLERSHLATIREAGACCYELHVGYRFQPGDAGQPWKISECFVDLADQAALAEIAQWNRELGLCTGQMQGPCSADALDYAAADESGRVFATDLLTVTARAAGQLEIPFVVVHPLTEFKTRYGASAKSQILAQLRRTIEEQLPDFVTAQTAIALENLPHSPGGMSLSDLVAICEEFNSPALGICLDTGHARLEGLQPAEAVRACGQWLTCLHVHDTFGESDQHLLPFDGDCDWSGFVPALRAVGYNGTLNLEVIYGPYQDKYASRDEMIPEAIRRVEALYAK